MPWWAFQSKENRSNISRRVPHASRVCYVMMNHKKQRRNVREQARKASWQLVKTHTVVTPKLKNSVSKPGVIIKPYKVDPLTNRSRRETTCEFLIRHGDFLCNFWGDSRNLKVSLRPLTPRSWLCCRIRFFSQDSGLFLHKCRQLCLFLFRQRSPSVLLPWLAQPCQPLPDFMDKKECLVASSNASWRLEMYFESRRSLTRTSTILRAVESSSHDPCSVQRKIRDRFLILLSFCVIPAKTTRRKSVAAFYFSKNPASLFLSWNFCRNASWPWNWPLYFAVCWRHCRSVANCANIWRQLHVTILFFFH